MTLPTVLAFAVIASVYLFASSAAQDLRRPLATGLLIGALIVTPWVVRNDLVLHTVVLTRTNVSYVFWLGNHLGTSGGRGRCVRSDFHGLDVRDSTGGAARARALGG